MYDTTLMTLLDGGFYLHPSGRRVYNPAGMDFCEVPGRIRNHHKWWARVTRGRSTPIKGAFVGCDHYEMYYECVADLATGNPILQVAHDEYTLAGRVIRPGDIFEVRQIVQMPHDPMGHCRGPWLRATVSGTGLVLSTHPPDGLWRPWCSGPRCHLWPDASEPPCPRKNPLYPAACSNDLTCRTLYDLMYNTFCRWPVSK